MPGHEHSSLPDPVVHLPERINALIREIRQAQQQLTEQLHLLPDNPAIHRISRHCYVMPARCLDQRLTLDPFRYDWQAQFERLAAHINTLSAHPAMTGKVLGAILTNLSEIVNGCLYHYAPEVIDAARPTLASALAIVHALESLRSSAPSPQAMAQEET